MPVMTGDELVAALRRAGYAVPAIVLTGFSERLTPALAAERGIAAVLAKPVAHRALLHALRTFLAPSPAG
ncbi:MAG: response regulator, partial [Caldilineaceae bacterium]|nr:response regulator [Caldilineaceae bacterium]